MKEYQPCLLYTSTPIEAILDQCAIISGENLIHAADEGTFGTFPAGTPANTGAPTEPYPGVSPDFTYVLPNPETFTPLDGEYTVQNIMNNSRSAEIGAWWRIADHTSGNETGRMMIVNGFNPGAIFFRETVNVTPNTNYLFSSWILNLFRVTGYPNPELGVEILDQNGAVLYSATLGALIPVNTNAPEWKEIGSVINSQNNTTLTVEFLSEGPEVIGNDYAIDDIALHEILIREFIPVKTASTSTVYLQETFEMCIRDRYQFDKAQSRLNSSCTKWDRYKSRYQIEEDVIPLWVADMDFECLPEVSEAIRKRAAHPIYGYTDPPKELYDAIIQWEKRQHDVEVRKEEIIFNTGVVYGFYTLIDMLVKHDEKVIVQPPVYPPFFNIPKSLQREVVYNPLQQMCIRDRRLRYPSLPMN